VDIGAADATVFNLDDRLTGSRDGLGPVFKNYIPYAFVYSYFHRNPSLLLSICCSRHRWRQAGFAAQCRLQVATYSPLAGVIATPGELEVVIKKLASAGAHRLYTAAVSLTLLPEKLFL
jgi:hypothetical protein